ncbi:MAG: hypothetical protein EA370_14375 [Wenzhouxiangella sp.]|nr:MAG: hypothetical protein EA370_14375 [Wenzhouxiangella sp.]
MNPSTRLGFVLLLSSVLAGASQAQENIQPSSSHSNPPLVLAQARTVNNPPQADPGSVERSTPLPRMPHGAFLEDSRLSGNQLRALRGIGINTAGDLADASPQRVGRILNIHPRQAHFAQERLRDNIRQRSPVSSPAQPARAFGMNSSVREIPGDLFVDGNRLRNTQISALRQADIRTVRDLLEAEPVQLGRLLDIHPRQASQAQQRLQAYLRDNRTASGPDPDWARQALSVDTSVAVLPAGVFLNERFNRNQIRALQGAGINTAGDLAEANTHRIAQVLRMNINQARAAQGRLQKALYD